MMTERRVEESESQQQRQQDETANNNNETHNSRNEEILYRFYFQTVLPDKSNTTAHSIRSAAVLESDEEEGESGVSSEKITSGGNGQGNSSSKPSSPSLRSA